MNQAEVFGFIGFGLIGGTLARAIRSTIPGARIYAFDPDTPSLLEAKKDGVIDLALYQIGKDFSACDIIFLCAPVSHNAENLEKLLPYIHGETILTDVGSVKTHIHQTVRRLGLSDRFIGGHPMTGSERIGYRNSKASLLQNAYYLLTPEKEFPEEKTKLMTDLVAVLGALPLRVSCERHDFATAAISHLPHLVSASLVNLVRDNDDGDGLLHTIAAGGFKDITRISSSSPVMWQQICLNNRDNILALVDAYIDQLKGIRRAIDGRDREDLYDFFDCARTYRDSFADIQSGALHRSFMIHVDIEDRPGLIAEVAGILAAANINIKNIGINHNREYEEGVLRIEFNSCRDRETAEALLSEHRFHVH